MENAKQILTKALEKAGITINGNKPYDIHVNDERLYGLIQKEPSVGAGEGYMKGMWDCERLDEMFYRISKHNLEQEFYKPSTLAIRYLVNIFFNLQTMLRSKEVAEIHYNLGNELYEYMLGKSMAYTCGYWKNASNLDESQLNKYELICRKIGLKKEDRVLELGCGWGMLAKYMAEKYGCQVVAVNISTEQVRYAQEHTKGLPVKVCLCDYRAENVYNPEKKLFDKVVSIGLCEHVGPKNYRTFVEIARRNLKEDGLFLMHTIGKDYTSYFCDPWISKYIFPNSLVPSVKLLSEAIEHQFVLEDLHNFGADYDKTLMAWHENFVNNWDRIQANYSPEFYRLWCYYLLSTAGAFRARTLQLWQLVLSPKGVPGGYQSIR